MFLSHLARGALVRRQGSLSLCHACFSRTLQERLRFGLDVRVVSLCHACFSRTLREGLRLDVRVVSLCHACFSHTLRERLRLDVRVVSLCQSCFSRTLRERHRLDVRVVSLCHACFSRTLRERLRLDVRRKTICSQNRSAGVITENILKLAPVPCMSMLIPKALLNFMDTGYGKNGKQGRRSRDYSIKPSGR